MEGWNWVSGAPLFILHRAPRTVMRSGPIGTRIFICVQLAREQKNNPMVINGAQSNSRSDPPIGFGKYGRVPLDAPF